MALEELGWRTVHFIHDPASIAALRSGDLDLRVLGEADAFTDTTLVPYAGWLAERFPSARFILTLRNSEDWLDSVERLFAHAEGEQDEDAPRFVNTAVYGMETFNRDHFRHVGAEHEKRIRSIFQGQESRLLCVDLTKSPKWDELCSFLDRPVPSLPFPHANNFSDGPDEAFR